MGAWVMDFGAFILLERHLDGIKNDGASIGGSMDDEGYDYDVT